ncbi:cobalamin biosynthesis protein CobD [Dissulfurispira thermophila]|uniref:Cobalamin biosynthesis protein CobD n=1 Tax=Dissulfurispira thermophila TaxID=2715679 RepID=A0A7G1H3L3_9BACT|nr:adenosylcobinamide-phosphate synthase CbiB [Dissulfurispira thermophila]BCB97394.1 cobalamin biosynthesis protein CobD [Dissulfurispira thermophila]
MMDSLFNLQPAVLILAFLLDMAIGDPGWLPHPVRIIGKAIEKIEKILRSGEKKQKTKDRLKGVFLVLVIVSSTLGLTWLIVYAIARISNISTFLHYCSIALLVYLTSTTIAARELIDSAKKVVCSVREGDLIKARKDLSMIVGRDTQNLSQKEILKATIETLSENLSDGVIAPIFYLIVGGLPLAMAYKAINTLDSMIGYKNEKYKDFGCVAAHLDDIANYIPARISGILIVIVSPFVSRSLFTVYDSLKTMINDGRNHPSPNAGIPEAAIAGALSVKLGGPSTYNGIVVEKPYIGIEKTENYLYPAEKAINIVKIASIIAISIGGVFLYARQ